MLKINKNDIVIHPFFIGIFFVLFIYSHNVFVIPAQELFFPLLLIISITFVSFFIGNKFLKNSKKSGLIISLYLILFFSFGHIYNIIHGLSLGDFEIGRYRYLVIPYIVVFFFGTYYLLKSRKKLENITKIGNVITITLLLFVVGNSLTGSINESVIDVDNTLEKIRLFDDSELSSFHEINEKQPNVYFIILDEYSSFYGLQEFFNYDNTNFKKFLNDKEFFIFDDSFANYPTTKSSLGATLNMKYLDELSDTVGIESKNEQILDEIVSNNFVMHNFKINGYEVVNFGSLWGPHNEFSSVEKNFCENKNFNRDSLTRELIQTSIIFYFFERYVEQERREVILCTFNEMSDIKSEKPIFAFIHILLPHTPFIFGPNGENITPGNIADSNNFQPRKAYVDQVIFANKKIKESINSILEKDNENSIIILQSDTGSGFNINWKNPSEKMIIERLSNLNAIYLPDKDYQKFEGKITPINTFPIIFNLIFEENYEILEDKMYWSSNDQPYYFKDVTNVLVNNKHG